MAKKGQTFKAYSGEFKIAVVEEIIKNGLGYREAERKYGLSRMLVVKWERIYLEEGADALMEERRGMVSKSVSPNKRQGLSKVVQTDLISEVQRLRMENEYLKKLHALALSKTESEKETKPE